MEDMAGKGWAFRVMSYPDLERALREARGMLRRVEGISTVGVVPNGVVLDHPVLGITYVVTRDYRQIGTGQWEPIWRIE
jgi:hypothetical protein